MLRHIVLVHGIWDTHKIFSKMAAALIEAGWTVHQIDIRPNNGSVPIAEQAAQLEKFIDEHLPAGNFSLLGFSMGGMICRYYAQSHADAGRIEHLITLGSPHQGTMMAYAGKLPTYLEFQPGSSFLKGLTAGEHNLTQIKRLSIYTPLDTVIVPAKSSIVVGWQNVALPVISHQMLLKDPRAIDAVLTFLISS